MKFLNANFQPVGRALWLQSFQQPTVWWRALKLGAVAGLVQAAINQGDHWLNHSVDATVFLKCVLSLLIAFTLVLISSAATWRNERANEIIHERNFDQKN